GQGRDNAKTFLDDNPEIFNEIDTLLRAKLGLNRNLAPTALVSTRLDI
ncbi:MAG: DNA recombination/repair protein RecA, partial [Armatimonadota bacterium]